MCVIFILCTNRILIESYIAAITTIAHIYVEISLYKYAH